MARKKVIHFAKDLYNAVEVLYTRIDSDESEIYGIANKVGIDRNSIKEIKIDMEDGTVSVLIDTNELVIFKTYASKNKDRWDIVSKLIFLLIS